MSENVQAAILEVEKQANQYLPTRIEKAVREAFASSLNGYDLTVKSVGLLSALERRLTANLIAGLGSPEDAEFYQCAVTEFGGTLT